MSYSRLAPALLVALTIVAAGCDDSSSSPDAGTPDSGPPDAGQPLGFAARCLLIASCTAAAADTGVAPFGVNDCFARAQLRPWEGELGQGEAAALQTLECQLAADDCAGVLACAPSPAAHEAACAGDVIGGACAGDTWVVCGFPSDDAKHSVPLAAVDCAASGETCAGEGGYVACGTATCDYSTYTSSCEANTLVHCSPAGVVVRTECPTDNTTVVISRPGPDGMRVDEFVTIAGEVCGIDHGDFEGQANCVGANEECDGFLQRCDGDVLTTCSGGRIAHRNCAALQPSGQTCGALPNGQLTCGVGASPTCTVEDAERCEDGVITYCALTHPETIDCRTLGYTGCAVTTPTGTERAVAYCTR